jgi:hypothetical protein
MPVQDLPHNTTNHLHEELEDCIERFLFLCIEEDISLDINQ